MSISRVASARTATVMVCVAAFPPIDATMGMSTASATISWMVASNMPMMSEATTAVPRLMSSHTKRERAVSRTESDSSSSPTPARRRMSSSASSRMTSTTSSMVSTPTSRPLASTTGADRRSYCSMMRAASS